jgi:hypothetical protein
MDGAVRPRVLAVAAAAAAGLVALGAIATVAVWGFRNGTDRSSSGVGGWLALVWTGVAVAIAAVVVVALAGVRSLRRPLVDLSRAATQLQVERLPAALRDIEAGTEPAPPPGLSAPEELEGVAGALESLERFVHYHATRAQRADRDLGTLLSGAADRAGARARVAEDIDPAASDSIAPGLHRDAGALLALVPDPVSQSLAPPEPAAGLGSSISDTVAATALTTLRPRAVEVGELQQALVDAGVTGKVMVVLGEVIDAAIGPEGAVVVHGSVQPEGYHFILDTAIGTRGAELARLAEALRDRDPDRLPFGLRAAVQAGRRARLLVWLTVSDAGAQWHLLVPPDSFVPVAVAGEPEVRVPTEGEVPAPIETSGPAVERVVTVVDPVGARDEPATAPEVPEVQPAATAPADDSGAHDDLVRLATTRRLGEALVDLLARLEMALEGRGPDGAGLDEAARIALLVDGTSLVGRLQEADLCSPNAQRALLRAIDEAAGAERPGPLAGSARDRVTLPYEALAEIRDRITEAAAAFPAPSSG